ncbi:hypothetical protein [Streptomyces sp. CBMA152]|uniref:hypothetical protein n=1 Tax=Streptomyces sp. CBMA152 TaxID=1896312 RepID=UPI00166096BE|nr:hypothetical protein [Streptomyces sp. CBMA152]
MEGHIPHAGPGAHCHPCWTDQQAALAEEKAKAEAKERAGERMGPPRIATLVIVLAVAGSWVAFMWTLIKLFA